jgi:hypothetical protein
MIYTIAFRLHTCKRICKIPNNSKLSSVGSGNIRVLKGSATTVLLALQGTCRDSSGSRSRREATLQAEQWMREYKRYDVYSSACQISCFHTS